MFSLLAAKRKVNSSPIRSGGKCFTACLSNKYSQRRLEWGNAPGLKCNFTSKIQAEIPGNAASLWLCATCYFPATPSSSLPAQSKPKQALAVLERSACFCQRGGAERALRLFPHGLLMALLRQGAARGSSKSPVGTRGLCKVQGLRGCATLGCWTEGLEGGSTQFPSPSAAGAGADPRVKKFLNKCHEHRVWKGSLLTASYLSLAQRCSRSVLAADEVSLGMTLGMSLEVLLF